MEKPIISIERNNLTSFIFYDELLLKLRENYSNKEQIIFNFRNLDIINPLVIPNLLCVGQIIKSNSKFLPKILVSSPNLKRYLQQISFLKLARDYELFEFEDSIEDGLSDLQLNERNTTVFFEKKEDRNDSYQKIIKFTNLYFDDLIEDETSFKRFVANTCYHIIENSLCHSETSVFLTMQYNHKVEKVYISISDIGIGFKESLNRKIKEKNLLEEGYLLDNKMVVSENEAIIKAIFARCRSEVYGLYNVVKKVIEKKGIIRIHSMNSRIIFTETFLTELKNKTSEEILKIINSQKFNNNQSKGAKYGGVHIEIEIPLEKIGRGD